MLPICVPWGLGCAEAHRTQRDSDEVLRKCRLPATEPFMVLLHASHLGLDLQILAHTYTHSSLPPDLGRFTVKSNGCQAV